MIVQSSHLDIATPTGVMRTYAYWPSEPGRAARAYPGVVLYSEIFQQTPPVARLAIGLASSGHVVMVPEVYHAHEPPGTVLGYDDAGKNRGNACKQLIPLSDFDEDARCTLSALEAHASCTGKLGVMGICLGGHLAFRAAFDSRVLAAACFYPTDLHSGTLGKGGDADSLARAMDIQGELMMVFGRQDPHVPDDGRRKIYDALRQAGAWFTWHEFNAAHAFLRDEGERYDPAATRLCQFLAGDLFARCL